MGGCVPSREAHPANKRQLLLIGLDGSGTTTTLYQAAFRGQLNTIPTLTAIIEEIQVGPFTCSIFNVGGLEKMRPVWRQYGALVDGVVFVVDAANRSRFKEASAELQKYFAVNNNVKSRGRARGRKKSATAAPDVPLLIFANKQDMSNAASKEEIEEALRCRQLPVRSYKVFECCAKTGDNISSGLDWMAAQWGKDGLPDAKLKA